MLTPKNHQHKSAKISVNQRLNRNQKNKVAVVGTGYVGLVSGACLAELGNEVICLDKDEEKIEKLQNGIVPIYEPGLSEIVKRNISKQRLFFDTDLREAIKLSEIIFICVGTPPNQDGGVDLSFVKEVAKEIGKAMKSPKIIVTKSTVPMGTSNNLVAKIIARYVSGGFAVVSNPEFLREGSAVEDFLHPDRIVIGADSDKAAKTMLGLYQKVDCPKIVTTIESAEMIKYASNAFLATKISFINEIANICERTGADIEEVAKGLGLDKRIGEHFLRPGLGYGGSCLPKDTRALHQFADADGYNFRLLQATIEVNDQQREKVIEKAKKLLVGGVTDKTIAVLGLAFKANTDDVRESPGLEIIKKLSKLGAKIKAFDPQAMANVKKILGDGIELCDNPYEAVRGADLIIMTTEWEEFRNLNWQRIKNLLREPKIVDGRNLLDPKEMRRLGFQYLGVGRNV